SNLLDLVKDVYWEQGFTSRFIMIYSDDQPIIDIFNTPYREMPTDMLHDLEVINSLIGEFGKTAEYAAAHYNWKQNGFAVDGFPAPTHPRLASYCSRRASHLIKLSIVSSVDRG